MARLPGARVRRPHPSGGQTPDRSGEGGFSLMEVLAAAAIATIAVIGLAHSFGVGRAFINRFEVSRAALAAVQGRLEVLSVMPPVAPDLVIGDHPLSPIPFVHLGRTVGAENWTVENFDDPATAATNDMKRVTARIVLNDEQGVRDTVSLSRLFNVQ